MRAAAWALLTAALAAAAACPAATAAENATTATTDPALLPFMAVADAPTNRGLKPQRWPKFGRMHYYQIPPDPIGTLVIFHGCGRASKAFFPWNPDTCEECLGFPEHVSQTKQALALGYAVLALDPLDFRHLCWSSSDRGSGRLKHAGNDQPTVRLLLREFLTAQGLKEKPLLLLGVSSGGTLALKLAVALEKEAEAAGEGEWVPRASGVISEESVPTDFGAADDDGKLRYRGFPPTIFVVMTGGNSRLDAPGVVEFLRDGGVPADVITSGPRPVVPTFFSDRIPAITQQQSRWIVEGMTYIGMLDADGWLLGDPERNRNVRKNTTSPAFNWDTKLKALLPWLADDSPTLSLSYRQCGIQQALNVAYARHDAVSDYLTVCLKWLESGGKADLPELLERYTVPDFNLTALTINGLEAPDFGAAEEEEGGAAAGGSVADEAAAGKDAAGEGAAAGGSAAGKAATAGANANAAGEEPAAGESGEAAEAAAPLEVRLGEEKEEPLAAQTSSAGRRRLLRRLF